MALNFNANMESFCDLGSNNIHIFDCGIGVPGKTSTILSPAFSTFRTLYQLLGHFTNF